MTNKYKEALDEIQECEFNFTIIRGSYMDGVILSALKLTDELQNNPYRSINEPFKPKFTACDKCGSQIYRAFSQCEVCYKPVKTKEEQDQFRKFLETR